MKAARFLAAKSLDASDFLAIPSPNEPLVMALNARLQPVSLQEPQPYLAQRRERRRRVPEPV